MGIRLFRTEGLVAGRLRQLGIFYGLVGLAKVILQYFHNVFDFHVASPVNVIPSYYRAGADDSAHKGLIVHQLTAMFSIISNSDGLSSMSYAARSSFI